MLYQEVPPSDSKPLDRWERLLVPVLIGAGALTAAIVALVFGSKILAVVCLIFGAGGVVFELKKHPTVQPPDEMQVGGPDYALVGSALGLSTDPVALTNGDGGLLIVNASYRACFGSSPPLDLASGDEAQQGLKLAQSMAWRDGAGCVARVETSVGTRPVEVERVGAGNDLLLWRFPSAPQADPAAVALRRVEGVMGHRLGSAGVMAAVVDNKGTILAANTLFERRALAPSQSIGKTHFGDVVQVGDDGQMRLTAEGEAAVPVRAVHIPADNSNDSEAGTFLLFETGATNSVVQSSNLQALLDVLPVGLALVDRDGRFLTVNTAFRQAAGIKPNVMPVYPGDLVVKEDKAAVADAVRRNARGPAMSGDLAVRLAQQSSDPVALTIAGLRGLGDAAVLLLLKDNTE